jgi:hypothetical protein
MDSPSKSMDVLADRAPGGSAALEPVLLAAPAPAPTAAAATKHSAAEAACRGARARVTIDQFIHLALQTLYGYVLFTNILLVQP